MSNLDFTGRNIIITGAGRGIGRSHALLVASRGANVIVSDLGGGVDGEAIREDSAAEVVAEITAAGGSAVASNADISTEEGAASVVETAVSAFGGVDVVINNAGIVRTADFVSISREDVQKYLDVHYFGSLFMARQAWEHLKVSGTGRIINTISTAMLGVPGMLHYGSSKAAVLGLSRSLAHEGFEFGIRTNAVAPGAATRMLEATAGSIDISIIEWMRTAVLPEQVSPMVAYLAHPSSQKINGEIFNVAGGAVNRLAFVQSRGINDPEHTIETVKESIATIMDLEGSVPQTVALV
ncbi:SDR family NAD(P)-dependent oxidoreductase [Pseudarthrobacter sp. NPDC058329]|uniref:SDR family NAD(P)-dependent oxidoreductase n=1 Tax=Pseudarthrobacter sp. NPDC058329 TaxID=3346448 RepID=UPI0036DC3FF8